LSLVAIADTDRRVNETAIHDGLQRSLWRDQQMLFVVAVTAVAISFAAVRVGTFEQVAGWFFGCAVLGVLGTLWYQFRTRTAERVLAQLTTNPAVKNVAVARFTINYIIPFGHVVAFDAGTLRDVNVGFWTRRRAEQFAAALADTAPSAAALPGARVV
jgi:hypothetical protein